VEYAGQVIGTRRGTEKNTIDSARLRANVEKLLRQSQQLQNDSVDAVKPVIEKQNVKTDSLQVAGTKPTRPNAVKKNSLPQAKENDQDEKKPKAIMPKKNL
jgi:hypothetical protein